MFPKFARRNRYVLERVRERAPPVRHPRAQHVEVALQEDDAGALPCDIHRLVDRDTDVGCVQRGSVVDAVPEVADRVAGALERAHDALLLLRIDLREE
jgi:hypothetical protein